MPGFKKDGETPGFLSLDIMQGVVFGTRIDEMGDDERLITRFDFDQCFGTVLNRYCAEAVVDHPLSPFGTGQQKRGLNSLVSPGERQQKPLIWWGICGFPVL